MGINVKKENDTLIITWQLSKTEIFLKDIEEVGFDETYGGEEKNAIRIGTPYGTTDRIFIKTTSNTYILFTTNGETLMNRIKGYL